MEMQFDGDGNVYLIVLRGRPDEVEVRCNGDDGTIAYGSTVIRIGRCIKVVERKTTVKVQLL
jgi:hypothetical protein